ncbi:TonB family protein [Mucilaginibacter sp. BJC16-A38]|uniref:energy transducer TonB n=1 Tax=Mucilaginibacter phenanthrenivorans TaxID=1234842 RepID=UPI0021583640|nr:energy transducer TonB [Mucilaginibacter phenanthrenivorans]MCR8557177.1 TonB family protein [Mucilaginibacter phenanthrenivorans]
MFISRFNLYKTEWLDVVFDDRNKEYGAYSLRREYAGTMVMAMGIAFFSIALIFGGTLLFRTNAVVTEHPASDTTVVNLQHYVKPPDVPHPPKMEEPQRPAKPIEPVKTTAFVPPVVKPDIEAAKPVVNSELTANISTTTTQGKPVEPGPQGIGSGTPGPPEPIIDTKVYTPGTVDVMPEPTGGFDTWNKFLSRNLKFPIEAQEDHISGKVFLSFIIEKDGHLSNITVIRVAGHGFDEEALRVLKLAKAWKPGIQNGQPVRVKYSIPINFQLTEE